MSADAEVRRAADVLVTAFASGDLETYFGCFADDATFLFHTTDRLLTSTDEYRREWAQWVADDGFRVVGCTSTDARIQVLGETAVLTHRVRTTVATNEGEAQLHERETIVFARQPDGRWLAVHEHLSPAPGD
jgi:uncharacterized protein (TIGR02246 family)